MATYSIDIDKPEDGINQAKNLITHAETLSSYCDSISYVIAAIKQYWPDELGANYRERLTEASEAMIQFSENGLIPLATALEEYCSSMVDSSSNRA